jgi:hypothetical protein
MALLVRWIGVPNTQQLMQQVVERLQLEASQSLPVQHAASKHNRKHDNNCAILVEHEPLQTVFTESTPRHCQTSPHRLCRRYWFVAKVHHEGHEAVAVAQWPMPTALLQPSSIAVQVLSMQLLLLLLLPRHHRQRL